jgi:hypothetical protein
MKMIISAVLIMPICCICVTAAIAEERESTLTVKLGYGSTYLQDTTTNLPVLKKNTAMISLEGQYKTGILASVTANVDPAGGLNNDSSDNMKYIFGYKKKSAKLTGELLAVHNDGYKIASGSGNVDMVVQKITYEFKKEVADRLHLKRLSILSEFDEVIGRSDVDAGLIYYLGSKVGVNIAMIEGLPVDAIVKFMGHSDALGFRSETVSSGQIDISFKLTQYGISVTPQLSFVKAMGRADGMTTADQLLFNVTFSWETKL